MTTRYRLEEFYGNKVVPVQYPINSGARLTDRGR